MKNRTVYDERSEFERDYDRIVYCSPFRRLQDKAQVFPLERNDSIRTRLTHSLEVSTLGRSLGRQVATRLNRERGLRLSSDDIGTIVATTCLAHDLGNPPFGHFGEEAIRRWFREHSELLEPLSPAQRDDFLGFDGNAQGLRILMFLQSLGYDDGMNLTFTTLAAFMKYVSGSDCLDSSVKTRSKIGYFQSEARKVRHFRSALGLRQARHPLAYLMEAADDIAYSVVDIEDGLKKRVLAHDHLIELLEEKLAGSAHTDLVEKLARDCTLRSRGPLHERVGMAVQSFRIAAIGRLFQAAVDGFMEHYEDIMAGTFHGDLVKATERGGQLWRALVEIGRAEVYCAPEVLALEVFGDKVIRELLSRFVPACLTEVRDDRRSLDGKHYALISSSLRSLHEKHTDSSPYSRIQLAVDYVSGMTDTYAVAVYERLHGGGGAFRA